MLSSFPKTQKKIQNRKPKKRAERPPFLAKESHEMRRTLSCDQLERLTPDSRLPLRLNEERKRRMETSDNEA